MIGEELADRCRWLAEAHAAEDSEETVAALCALYRLLASRGWTPPERVSNLLRLHDAAVDAALLRLMTEQGAVPHDA